MIKLRDQKKRAMKWLGGKMKSNGTKNNTSQYHALLLTCSYLLNHHVVNDDYYNIGLLQAKKERINDDNHGGDFFVTYKEIESGMIINEAFRT